MARFGNLAMKTDQPSYGLINSDLVELKTAAKKLASDAMKLGGLGFGTSFLAWVASISAIYLLVLDRTNWKSNILTSLLVPYIFFSLPSIIFNILRGQIGSWIAFVAVVLRLFFPKHFPDWLDMPASLILLLVVAPSLFANTVRNDWIGIAICLVIGCYLLQEHIRASGGFRNSFTKTNGYTNTIGICLLLVYPVWALIVNYLLILDRTNWKTNILTSLLVPYIFFSLPSIIFNLLRGEIGMWIAFIAVVLRLFFPKHYPDWLEMPGSLILLLVVAPNLFADTIRNNWVGVMICLAIGCYLLQEHIRASGGFRNSFTRTNGYTNTIGIILLLVYPVWALLLKFI